MINISIVLYKHNWLQLKQLITSLLAVKGLTALYLIDNSPSPCDDFSNKGVHYIFTGSNRGYGAGHNIALRKTIRGKTPYHLVINPDIELQAEAVNELVEFMDKSPETALLMPKIKYPDGSIQYLCKLLPTPTDLLFRRFLPTLFSRKKMYRFEMRKTAYESIMEVPYLSGCFMLLRTSALIDVGLFDERFFMYPEDIDLTRRLHQHYKTLFYPHVSIIHHHEKSSYASIRMLMIHLLNLARYFNKWGWCYDPERSKINRRIIELNNL